jgi:hypothetical protein
MSPDIEHKLAQVRKYSTSLRRLFNFCALLVAIGGVVSLLILLTRTGDNATIFVWNREFAGDQITWTLKLLAGIWLILVFGIALKLLRHLARLFDLYSQGQIFTADNVRQIRQIGISVLLIVTTFLYGALARMFLYVTGHPTPAAPPTRDTLGIDIDAGFWLIIGGIVIIVISWIMDVGRELREESDLTV